MAEVSKGRGAQMQVAAGCAPSAGSEAGHRKGTFVSLPTFLIVGDIESRSESRSRRYSIPLPEHN